MRARAGARPAATLILACAALVGPAQAGEERTRVLLDDGTAIVGDVVASDAERLTIDSPALGRVRVPRARVASIREPGHATSRRASALERLGPSPTPPEPLEIRPLRPDEPAPAGLVERAISFRVVEPPPARIAE